MQLYPIFEQIDLCVNKDDFSRNYSLLYLSRTFKIFRYDSYKINRSQFQCSILFFHTFKWQMFEFAHKISPKISTTKLCSSCLQRKSVRYFEAIKLS